METVARWPKLQLLAFAPESERWFRTVQVSSHKVHAVFKRLSGGELASLTHFSLDGRTTEPETDQSVVNEYKRCVDGLRRARPGLTLSLDLRFQRVAPDALKNWPSFPPRPFAQFGVVV